MIKIRQINNEFVVPILKPNANLKVVGKDLFPEVYANIFLCARKKTGKTTAIYKILEKCTTKHTRIVIFASTVHKDPIYKKIVKDFEKKGNDIEIYTDLKDGKEDILQGIINELKKDISDEEEEKAPISYMQFPSNMFVPIEPTSKNKNKKKLAPEIVFVLDDLGTQLKTKSVDNLLKTNRHYKSKVLIGSQYPHDLSIEGRRQLDYCLLFRRITIEKLQILYNDFDLDTDFDLFYQLYKHATDHTHQFLYVDIRNSAFRRGFSHEYLLQNE